MHLGLRYCELIEGKSIGFFCNKGSKFCCLHSQVVSLVLFVLCCVEFLAYIGGFIAILCASKVRTIEGVIEVGLT
jgi:hypothetical protein